MRKVYKSLVLAGIPWVMAFISYTLYPLLLGEAITPFWEAGGFTVFHGILDSLAIFIVANLIFQG